MNYEEFIRSRKRQINDSGFNPINIDDRLFDFQKYAVEKALIAGRYALFEECGLGKTFQQLVWADQVARFTNEPVTIIAPLGVTGQTIKEAEKLDLEVCRVGTKNSQNKIYITNYERLDEIDIESAGIVLDESSILKSVDGATKAKLLNLFKRTKYKLACTATPSPNDDMEMCNHAEFLNHGKRTEILATYFTHDGGETSKWRLKGHAQKVFWDFVRTWSLFISNPSDVGFDGSKYVLPKLNLIERMVNAPNNGDRLFNDLSVSATNFNQELRNTMDLRIKETVDIIRSKKKESFIVWCKQNEESRILTESIKGSIEVKGSESPEAKEEKLLAFAAGEYKTLVTKTKIAGFGMNFQNCHNQVHASLDFSFESLYQSIRRSYRFGQKHPVNIWLITTDTMVNVIQTIKQKQEQFEAMKYHLTKN